MNIETFNCIITGINWYKNTFICTTFTQFVTNISYISRHISRHNHSLRETNLSLQSTRSNKQRHPQGNVRLSTINRRMWPILNNITWQPAQIKQLRSEMPRLSSCIYYRITSSSVCICLLPFLIIFQFPIRQKLIPHTSKYIWRSFSRNDNRLDDSRRNLPQDPTNGTSDTFMFMFLNSNGIDVSSSVT